LNQKECNSREFILYIQYQEGTPARSKSPIALFAGTRSNPLRDIAPFNNEPPGYPPFAISDCKLSINCYDSPFYGT
jgi:hypothetical protein